LSGQGPTEREKKNRPSSARERKEKKKARKPLTGQEAGPAQKMLFVTPREGDRY